MPIPPTHELLVREEIKSAIFEQAFIELATEFAARHPDNFAVVARKLIEVAEAYPLGRFRPPEIAQASSVDIKRMRQEGFERAVGALGETLDRILQRLRPRQR